jgi:hypothetical protein
MPPDLHGDHTGTRREVNGAVRPGCQRRGIVVLKPVGRPATSRAIRPRAIGGPLTLVSQGPSRSLTVRRMSRSGRSEGRICRFPKLIVRVRFPSPALRRKRTSEP